MSTHFCRPAIEAGLESWLVHLSPSLVAISPPPALTQDSAEYQYLPGM